MQLHSKPATGQLSLPARRGCTDLGERRGVHPADGARVVLVSNRMSGLLVELTHDHRGYSKGDQLVVASDEFIRTYGTAR